VRVFPSTEDISETGARSGRSARSELVRFDDPRSANGRDGGSTRFHSYGGPSINLHIGATVMAVAIIVIVTTTSL
jgi:hypothetical protein